MPTNVLTPYRLKRNERRALIEYFMGRQGIDATAQQLGITRQRLYTMTATIMRHMCTTGRIDIETILKDY